MIYSNPWVDDACKANMAFQRALCKCHAAEEKMKKLQEAMERKLSCNQPDYNSYWALYKKFVKAHKEYELAVLEVKETEKERKHAFFYLFN